MIDRQRVAVLAQPDAGVVDEDVDAATEGVERRRDGCTRTVGRPEVGADHDRLVGQLPGDGLELHGARVTAPVHCAPPDNRPTPSEFDNCRDYLAREAALLSASSRPRVFVALGALAFDACVRVLSEEGATIPRPRPRFAHGAVHRVGQDRIVCTYHPSQQNTFTGKLTQRMLREVLRKAKRLASPL